MRSYRSFEEFWPHYLDEHGKPGTRALHFAGTALALLCLPLAIALRNPWLLPVAPIVGYGLAWIGHFFVERNRPASFDHPLWSMRADLRMFVRTLARRLPKAPVADWRPSGVRGPSRPARRTS